MDRLRCIEVFVEVARDGSFTGAARRLGVSKATATKHVAALEQSLGAKLLNRTTQHVGLTEAGVQALAQCKSLLEGYEEIAAGARDLVEKPRGIVRVGAPPSFGTHHLVPVLTEFTERYPDIRIVLSLDDGSANLITQGLDLSIRIGLPPDDIGHIAVPLTKAPQVLVASKSYLRQHGTPHSPADLDGHNCLVHSLKSPTNIWRFSSRCRRGVGARARHDQFEFRRGAQAGRAARPRHLDASLLYGVRRPESRPPSCGVAGLSAAQARYLRGLPDARSPAGAHAQAS